MRVLVVTPSYPTLSNPAAGAFVREQSLAAAEHAEVAVLHLARGEPWRVRRIEGEPLPTWRSGYPSRPAAVGLVAAAARGLRAAPPHDIVHAHFFLGAAPLLALSRKPLVLTEHWTAFLPEDPQRLSPALLAVARAVCRRACAVLPVSEALRRGMEDSGIRARAWRVVPNAVDEGTFTAPAAGRDGTRLLAVGLLNGQKAYDVLLRAFAALRSRRRDVSLEIVGDGELRRPLERLADELGVRDAVTFAGFLPKWEVAARMAGAGLLVSASRFESNGVVVLEALVTGLPVVATALPATRELVDESNGRLVPPDDPAALAAAMEDALSRTAAFDGSAIAARARDRYGAGAVGRALAEVYRECLAA